MKEKKRIISAGLVVIALAIICLFLIFSSKNGSETQYTLGKTPYSYQCTFGTDFVLYKDYVSKNGNQEFSGIYLHKLNMENDDGVNNELLSDSFLYCANIYKDSVIFINTENNIEQIDLKDNTDSILYDNHGNGVHEALVVNDDLYFIVNSGEDTDTLMTINLIDNTQKEIVKNINFHYLYHYRDNVVVITKDGSSVIICNASEGMIEEHPNLEYEIQGFLDDGSIILSRDANTICALNDFESTEEKVLFEMDNIHRIIVHEEELLVCTLDYDGLVEVFIYDFATGSMDKIADTDTEPDDFNEEYIICSSYAATGLTELIDRRTGEMETIGDMGAVTDKEEKTDTEENLSKDEEILNTEGDLPEDEKIQSCLTDYFSDLYETLREDSEKDFDKDDFSSINGYISAKYLVAQRYCYQMLLGGIHKVKIKEVVLEDWTDTGDTIEATAYVRSSFRYGKEPEPCSEGTYYGVVLSSTEEGYCVQDIDNQGSTEVQMAKECIQADAVSNYSDEYAAADAYFEEQKQTTDSMLLKSE